MVEDFDVVQVLLRNALWYGSYFRAIERAVVEARLDHLNGRLSYSQWFPLGRAPTWVVVDREDGNAFDCDCVPWEDDLLPAAYHAVVGHCFVVIVEFTARRFLRDDRLIEGVNCRVFFVAATGIRFVGNR